ncbi:uncharacterized protein LOC129740544 [Uranotaenia lowii]|uniref:uncharacterized protein LOC129740544 n=1 Tax=Uranotaenia lowii TaxID=190385 RepID=UPI0024783B55|nr:uncharacterized protein LOC129740544 [Uranotaenia lowii]
MKAKFIDYIPDIAQTLCSNLQDHFDDVWFALNVKRMKGNVRYPLRETIRLPKNENQTQNVFFTGIASYSIEMSSSIDHFCLGSYRLRKDLLKKGAELMDADIFYVFLLVVDTSEKAEIARWKTGQFIWNITNPANDNGLQYQCQLWDDQTSWSSTFCESTMDTKTIACNCSRLDFMRLVAINSSTITTETPRTTSDEKISRTVQVTTTELASTISNILETTTDTDMLTFAPLSSTTSLPTIDAPVTTSSTQLPTTTQTPSSTEALESTTVATTTTTTQLPKINATRAPGSTAELPTITPTTEQLSDQGNSTQKHHHFTSSAGPLSYSIMAALAVCVLFTGVALVLYRRRRHTTTLAEELQTITARLRSNSAPVRYARFQDEHNMIGDNVSTISDTVTI